MARLPSSGSRLTAGWVSLHIGAAVVAAAGWVLFGRAINHLQPDLGVYYYSPELGDDLYGSNIDKPIMPTGGLPFTYTPFAAVVFRLFSVVPFDAATWLWALLNCVSVVVTVLLVTRGWRQGRRFGVTVVALLSSPIAAHVVVGQINALLLAMVMVDCYLIGRPELLPRLPRGIGIGLAAAIKLTPAVVILFLAVARRRGPAVTALLTAAAATALGAVVLPNSTVEFLGLLTSLSDRVDVLGYFATPMNSGVTGMLAQLGIESGAVSGVVAVTVVVAGLLFARRIRAAGMIPVGITLSLVACLASPVTWVHHWVVLPIALCWALGQRPSRALRIVLVAGLITQLTGSALLGFPALPAGLASQAEGVATLAQAIWSSSPLWSSLAVFATIIPLAKAQLQRHNRDFAAVTELSAEGLSAGGRQKLGGVAARTYRAGSSPRLW